MSLLLPILAGFVLLYIIIDLFDRLDILLRHDATVAAAARYFLFKIPLMLTQITPPAVITAALLTFGLMGRRNEIIALRAGGVSLMQTAVPVLVLSLAISVAALVWNETVVPVLLAQVPVREQRRDPQAGATWRIERARDLVPRRATASITSTTSIGISRPSST